MISWVLILSIGLVIGIGVGAYASRLDMFRSKKQLELEQKLHDTQEELGQYRKDVTQHFVQTSSLVNDMTESYRAVFDHLSHGAKQLCGDQVHTTRLDFPDTHLIEDTAETDETSEADLDLEAKTETAAEDEVMSADIAEETTTEDEAKAADVSDENRLDTTAPMDIKQEKQIDEKNLTAQAEETSDTPAPENINSNDIPSAQDTLGSDDEHAAYIGEQDGPPVTQEEKPKTDDTPTVH